MKDEERNRIRTRLNYWLQHNNEHSQELREWAGKVRASGEVAAADEMLQAAQEMDKASEILSRALRRLEGKER